MQPVTKATASKSRKKKVNPAAIIVPIEAGRIEEGSGDEDNSDQDTSMEVESNWWTCPKCKKQLKHFHDGSSLCHNCYGRYLRTDQINITGLNPRKSFDDEQLAELQASIKEYGILEPLIVRPAAAGMFDLVAGERRFRSACNLQLKLIPVDIQDLTDEAAQDIMLIENIQREQLSPLEEAWAIRDRLSQGDITQEVLAGKLGKTQPWLANRLRLLQAPEDIQDLLISREISAKHVIAMLPYAKYPIHKEIMTRLKEDLKEQGPVSVKKLEDIIKGRLSYGNSVLDLDDLPYDCRELKRYLDLSKCEKCSDIISVTKRYDNKKHKICPVQTCWQQLIAKARKKSNEALEARIAGLRKEDFVDTNKLGWEQYKQLNYASFDKAGCDQCQNLKFTKEMDPICLDPKCYNKKDKAKEKQAQKKARDEASACWEAVDELLDRSDGLVYSSAAGLNNKTLQTMVNIFGVAIWGETAKKGLSKWGKVPTSQYCDEFKAFLENIPDEDLAKVMVRLMVAVRFTQCSGGCGSSSGANLETLKEVLPEAAAFYKAPEAEK